jgi:uncharacterized phage-like protein YoqJ
MIKIAITGHRPDAFLVSHYLLETIQRAANDMVAIFKREHKDELMFNLGGAIGVDQWVGAACIDQNVPYVLYLPFHPDVQSKFWTQEQKDELARQVKFAAGINIVEPNPEAEYFIGNYQKRNERMIDEANFVVAFWVGKRRGGTYNAIKYGLKKSKFVFNALDNLCPLFNENLKKGWTPSTMKAFSNE